VYERDTRQTDKQTTDRVTEKCVAIAAIPPKNTKINTA